MAYLELSEPQRREALAVPDAVEVRCKFMLEVDRHLQRRIRLRPIDDTRIASGGFRVLVAEHVLHRAQIMCVTLG